MSIQDLRDTLRLHAATVDDTGLAGRAAAARRQATSVRRRQTVAVVAAAAVLLPAAWLAAEGVNPFDRSAPVVTPPDHVPPDEFVESFAGRTLIDSQVVTGESEIVFAAPVSRNTEWRAICRKVGSAYTLHMSMDGGTPGELPCDVELLSGRLIAFQLGPEYPLQGEHTLRIWLTRSSDGTQVAPPDGRLGTAVYSLPPPVATVAGHELQELEADAADEFRVTTYEESDPGDRSFSSTYPSSDVPVLVDWYTSSSSSGNVQVYVDGRPEVAISLGEGGPGLVLAPGRSHSVRLRVVGDVPPDTLLGFAWREQVP